MGGLQRVQARRQPTKGGVGVGVERRGRSRCRGRSASDLEVSAEARRGLRRRDGGRESVGIWGKRGGMKRGVGILGVKWA